CFIVILASCIDTSNACHYDAVDLISVSLRHIAATPNGRNRHKTLAAQGKQPLAGADPLERELLAEQRQQYRANDRGMSR
ncbi:hypothetical protein U6L45_12365, partial [Cutibacterium acnes]